MSKTHPSAKEFKDILLKTNLPKKKIDKLFRKATIYLRSSHGKYKEEMKGEGLRCKNRISLAFNTLFN